MSKPPAAVRRVANHLRLKESHDQHAEHHHTPYDVRGRHGDRLRGPRLGAGPRPGGRSDVPAGDGPGARTRRAARDELHGLRLRPARPRGQRPRHARRTRWPARSRTCVAVIEATGARPTCSGHPRVPRWPWRRRGTARRSAGSRSTSHRSSSTAPARPTTRACREIVSDMVARGRRAEAVRTFLRTVGVPKPVVMLMRLMPAWKQMTAVAHTLPYDLSIVVGHQQGEPLPAGYYAEVAPRRWSSPAARARRTCATPRPRSPTPCPTPG